MKKKSLLYRAAFLSFVKIFSRPALWRSALKCMYSIQANFFMLQTKAVLFPKKTPVAHVDHPLDGEIPFSPEYVGIYMDFSPFWVRVQGFLLERYGERAVPHVREFLETVDRLYIAAASVARRHFSTTKRPRYYGTLNFILIHLFDPHLMCIPSLHVIMVICTFLKFQEAVRAIDAGACSEEIAWVRQHAIDITESILYVKQHSVNCIPAALYTLTRYDPNLFNENVLKEFVGDLFVKPQPIQKASIPGIKNHILSLYATFLGQGTKPCAWQEPLFAFLREPQGTGGLGDVVPQGMK